MVPAAIVEVSDLVFAAAAGACTLDARVRALAPGTAALVVRDAGGREVTRRELTVEEPRTIGVGELALLDTDPIFRHGDLDAIEIGPEGMGVIAVGRDEEGGRLALGAGATWSTDDPRVASVAPSGGVYDVSLARLEPISAGETTLRIAIGDRERAIPVRVSAD